MHILLASGSPRRKSFLETLGFDISVIKPFIDETPLESESPEDMVLRLSKEKAGAIKTLPEHIVLAADTIVVLNGQMLGKPSSTEEARKTLQKLSGNCHEVMTGYILQNENRSVQNIVKTKVWFRKLRNAEIENYILTKEPYDKSGGYGVQGQAAAFVDRIEGSYTNIIGLPIKEVFDSLETFGYE